MGLFKKKGEEKKGIELPELPELPKLPEISEFERINNEKLPQLPIFPNGDLGNKFSQNTIKEAVTGEKEEKVNAEEFEQEIPMMRKPFIKESEEEQENEKITKTEPIFIRMDRFEEGSKNFEEIKKKVISIEKILSGVKKAREDEERELKEWGEEIIHIKEKLEKVDENIFSKLK
jgi:hypothetical protein